MKSDLTVMPDVTLTLAPGVVMEFTPKVGILVLGRLVAKGRRGEEIIFRPHPGEKKQKPSSSLKHRYALFYVVLNVKFFMMIFSRNRLKKT